MISKELEKQILNALLFKAHKVPLVFKILSVDDFKHYRRYVEVILPAWKKEEDISQAIIYAGLNLGDIYTEDSLFSDVERAARKLKKLNATENVRQILSNGATSLTEETLDEVVPDMQQALVAAVSETSTENTEIATIIKEFRDYQDVYEQKRVNGGSLLGLSTGFSKLDEVIDGLRPGHLWVLGGYTNLGKTYASLNIMSNLIKKGHRTVFYSLEMSRVDILARVLGILCKDNGNGIAKGLGDKAKVDAALALVEKSNTSIHSTKSELSQILMSMYEETLKDKPSVFVLDFLQLVTVKGTKSEYEGTTKAILELQKAAQQFGVPIIVLSQVSNESAKQGDQQVMGFKGSGAIAAAADLAIELVSGEENVIELRRKMNEGLPVIIKWHIKKNRHGRVGSMEMQFTGKHGIFEDYEDNY